MKYPQIESLVPEKEHFDLSAINEGVYLTVGHVTNIEESLQTSSTAVEAVQSNLAEANNTIEDLNQSISTLNDTVTAHESTISDRDAKITALEARVTELGGQSSGKGTTLPVNQDEQDESNKPTPSYLDDSNPINSWIDKKVKRK
jgi:chromosome segregation ATPase